MKKFIYSLTLIVAALLVSCNTQYGLVYNVSIVGTGDGAFEVTFPQGSYSMNGTADLALALGDSLMFASQQVTSKETLLKRSNKKELSVLNAVNDSIANKFSAKAASGTYDILITGLVKEVGTGLTFSINRRITNKENLRALVTEPYAFIE